MARKSIQPGDTFGRLTAAAFHHRDKGGNAFWNFRCSCGNITTQRTSSVLGGTQSCGCLRGNNVRTHGLSKLPEFYIWQGIKYRCLNPKASNSHNYSERGIKIHPEWVNDFLAFYTHIGPRPSPQHSIDRINNDGNYEPGNVRWATRKEQNRNTRWNTMVTIGGRTQCVMEWAEHLNLTYDQIRWRWKLLKRQR